MSKLRPRGEFRFLSKEEQDSLCMAYALGVPIEWRSHTWLLLGPYPEHNLRELTHIEFRIKPTND